MPETEQGGGEEKASQADRRVGGILIIVTRPLRHASGPLATGRGVGA